MARSISATARGAAVADVGFVVLGDRAALGQHLGGVKECRTVGFGGDKALNFALGGIAIAQRGVCPGEIDLNEGLQIGRSQRSAVGTGQSLLVGVPTRGGDGRRWRRSSSPMTRKSRLIVSCWNQGFTAAWACS